MRQVVVPVFIQLSTTLCCLQEDAFDEKGEFRQDRLQSINKVGTRQMTLSMSSCCHQLVPYWCVSLQVGHALHDLNPVFQRVTYTQQVGEIAR